MSALFPLYHTSTVFCHVSRYWCAKNKINSKNILECKWIKVFYYNNTQKYKCNKMILKDSYEVQLQKYCPPMLMRNIYVPICGIQRNILRKLCISSAAIFNPECWLLVAKSILLGVSVLALIFWKHFSDQRRKNSFWFG